MIYEAIVIDLDNVDIFKGSIAGGGRYDKMLGKFTNSNKDICAVGVSLGVERIISMCKDLNISLSDSYRRIDVYVGSVGKNMLKDKIKICSELRKNGIKAECSMQNNAKMGNQLNFVFENKIQLMIIIGEDEIKRNVIQLKYIDSKIQIEYPREIKEIAKCIKLFYEKK